ncbi:hypothetical protein ISCGN_031752 [Ixodes scapularis]
MGKKKSKTASQTLALQLGLTGHELANLAGDAFCPKPATQTALKDPVYSPEIVVPNHEGSDLARRKMSSKESSMTVLVDRVNEQAVECSKQSKDYRIILPRLPTGMLVTNSLFLHADMSGRPYKAADFKEVLFSMTERTDLIALGPYQMSHVWMTVFANGAAKCKIKACEELEIKQKRCLVIDPTKDEIKMKLLWLPPQLPGSEIKKVLEPFGTVKDITREKWRFSDLEETDTLTRIVTLVLKNHLTVDKVPHTLNIYGVNSLVVIPGRPLFCLRCKAIGHIRRQCSTPRCTQCWRFGHSTEECIVTYASKLQGNASPVADVSEHIMDVDEMFTKDLKPMGESQGSHENTSSSAMSHIDDYCPVSGALVNKDKSSGSSCGEWDITPAKFVDIEWTTSKPQLLGVPLNVMDNPKLISRRPRQLMQTPSMTASEAFTRAPGADFVYQEYNEQENTLIFGTPDETRAGKLNSIQGIEVDGRQYPVARYVAAPDDTVKGSSMAFLRKTPMT